MAIVLGVVLYALYRAYQDQLKYNREQDKLTSDILSKLVPVVEGLKEGTIRTGDYLDRNLRQVKEGNDRVSEKLAAMTSSIEKLEVSLSAFMLHIRGKSEQ